MSSVKHNSPSHSTSKAHKKSEAPKAKSDVKKAEKPKETEKAKETPKDSVTKSPELSENQKVNDAQKAGETKTDPTKPGDPKGEKPGDPKAEKTDKEKEAEKGDAVKEKLAALEEELRQLKEDKEKKPEKPEDLGGCCGKSQGSKKSGDEEGKTDPNQELDQLASQVMAAQANGGKLPADAVQGADKADKAGAAKDAKGAGKVQPGTDVATLRGTLKAKYENYKKKGTELKPEVEQHVQQALGGGFGAQPGQTGQTGQTGQPGGAASQPQAATAAKKA